MFHTYLHQQAASGLEKFSEEQRFVLRIGGDFPRTAIFAIGRDHHGREMSAMICQHNGQVSKVFNDRSEMRAAYKRHLSEGWEVAAK